MLYFQSYITCILIILWFQEKYFFHIEYSWTWNHKKLTQRAVEYELQLNCCLFLTMTNAAENVHWNTEHRKIMSNSQVYGPRTLKSPFIERINIMYYYHLFICNINWWRKFHFSFSSMFQFVIFRNLMCNFGFNKLQFCFVITFAKKDKHKRFL